MGFGTFEKNLDIDYSSVKIFTKKPPSSVFCFPHAVVCLVIIIHYGYSLNKQTFIHRCLIVHD